MENFSYESIDIIDSLCSNIRVDLRGTEIVRILPRKNDNINEDWITDTARYAFDGLKNQRMGLPMFYKSSVSMFKISSWSHFYETFTYYYINELLLTKTLSYAHFNVGSSLDLYSSYILSILSKMIPSSKICFGHFPKQKSYLSTQSFLSSIFFTELERADFLIFNNISFSSEYPLIKTRLRRLLETDIASVSFGKSRDTLFDKISLSNDNYVRFFRGKLFHSNNLIGKKCVISCSPTDMISELMYISKHAILDKTCIMHTNLQSNYLSHLQSNYLGDIYDDYEIISATRALFYGIDSPIPLNFATYKNNYFYVSQGTHKNINHFFNGHTSLNQHIWYLPTSSYFEEDMPYFNILGILQWTKKVIDNYNFSQSNSSILVHLVLSLHNLGVFSTIHITNGNVGTSLSRYFLDKVPSLLTSRCIEQSYARIENIGSSVNTWHYSNSSGPLFVQYSSVINQVKRAKDRYFSQFNVFI